MLASAHDDLTYSEGRMGCKTAMQQNTKANNGRASRGEGALVSNYTYQLCLFH